MRIDAKKIRNMLFDKGIKQKELDSMAGISNSTMSAITNGLSCSSESGRKIAAALGVSIEEIERKVYV